MPTATEVTPTEGDGAAVATTAAAPASTEAEAESGAAAPAPAETDGGDVAMTENATPTEEGGTPPVADAAAAAGGGADAASEKDAEPAAEAAAAAPKEAEEEVAVPAHKVGAIIGRGGATVVDMERVSGARIQIPRDKPSGEGDAVQVRVCGTAPAVAKAKELIAAATAPPVVNLAGYKFDSNHGLSKHCQEIIQDATEGEPIAGGRAFFLYALLSHHPDAPAKYGAGVTAIKYGVNAEFPDSKCFLVVREDGTEVGFSYRKCVDAVFAAAGRKRGRDEPGDPRGGAPPQRPRMEMVPGLVAVVEATTLDPRDHRKLREVFGACGKVKYVEMAEGKAYVRFDVPAAAARAAEEVREVDDHPVTVTVLSGEEEKKYWERLWASHDRAAAEGGGGGRYGGRGGRGGRRGGRWGGRGGRGGGRGRGRW